MCSGGDVGPDIAETGKLLFCHFCSLGFEFLGEEIGGVTRALLEILKGARFPDEARC
ncbi:hypothetical protein AALP_AA5G129900 [Arabis alpina]|uniref:Uncharacterized protein n=1 Tax=Arabis alpina TaxID=50452 RepID=A0A087GWS0_ARAAL|nr:hypothetical protein AALP_AA5G129900 [Arabis alpina]